MRAGMIIMSVISMLAACSDPVKDAERELQIIMDTGGSQQDQCRARQKIAEAYLKAQDTKGYQEAKIHAEGACLGAQLEQKYGRH